MMKKIIFFIKPAGTLLKVWSFGKIELDL